MENESDENEIKTSSNDFITFKDEILKKIRLIENKITNQINLRNSEINDNYELFNQKINGMLECNKAMIESVVNQKSKLDKVSEIELLTNKMNSMLITHEVRINNILDELQNIQSRYDKILTENLTVPGYVGPGSKYKSISDYLLNNITEFTKIQVEEEQIKKDISNNKIKLENLIKNTLGLIDSAVLRCKNYTDSLQKDFKNSVESKIMDFAEKNIEIRTDVYKNQLKTEKQIEEMKKEITKILDIKSEVENLIEEKFNNIDSRIENSIQHLETLKNISNNNNSKTKHKNNNNNHKNNTNLNLIKEPINNINNNNSKTKKKRSSIEITKKNIQGPKIDSSKMIEKKLKNLKNSKKQDIQKNETNSVTPISNNINFNMNNINDSKNENSNSQHKSKINESKNDKESNKPSNFKNREEKKFENKEHIEDGQLNLNENINSTSSIDAKSSSFEYDSSSVKDQSPKIQNNNIVNNNQNYILRNSDESKNENISNDDRNFYIKSKNFFTDKKNTKNKIMVSPNTFNKTTIISKNKNEHQEINNINNKINIKNNNNYYNNNDSVFNKNIIKKNSRERIPLIKSLYDSEEKNDNSIDQKHEHNDSIDSNNSPQFLKLSPSNNLKLKCAIINSGKKQQSKIDEIKEFYENRQKKCLQKAMGNVVDCNIVNLRLTNSDFENPKNDTKKENIYTKLSSMSVKDIFRKEKINFNIKPIKNNGEFGRTTYFFYSKRDIQNDMIPIQNFRNRRLNSMKLSGSCFKSSNSIFSSRKNIYTPKNKKAIFP